MTSAGAVDSWPNTCEKALIKLDESENQIGIEKVTNNIEKYDGQLNISVISLIQQ